MVITPKVNRFPKCWNDNLKLELLRQYILYAEYPMLSSDEEGHQQLLKEQCLLIKDRIICH